MQLGRRTFLHAAAGAAAALAMAPRRARAEAYPTRATRPRNSRLDLGRIRERTAASDYQRYDRPFWHRQFCAPDFL